MKGRLLSENHSRGRGNTSSSNIADAFSGASRRHPLLNEKYTSRTRGRTSSTQRPEPPSPSPPPPRHSLLMQQEPSESHGGPVRAMVLLRPVFSFLVTAAVLIPLQLYVFREEGCLAKNLEFREEKLWATLTRGLWIAWLTHAAGVMDETLRVFLGIRLTMGLGTPASVGKIYSKMSRRAEVVAKGIAVDDFPALRSLYGGTGDDGGGGGGTGGEELPARTTHRASSGEVGDSVAVLEDARGSKSLVMNVERVAVTAWLWSLVPWSRVRRYDKVHVKGITLRLRQVNGILNFSFLALRKSPEYYAASDSHGGGGGGSEVGGAGNNGSTSDISGGISSSNSSSRNRGGGGGSIEDLDGIVLADASDEEEEEVTTLSSEADIAIAIGQQVREGVGAGQQRLQGAATQHSRERDLMAEDATGGEAPDSPRDSIDTNVLTAASEGGVSSASTSRLGRLARSRFGNRGRRISAPAWGSDSSTKDTVQQRQEVGGAAPVGDGGGRSAIDAPHDRRKSARSVQDGTSPPPKGGILSANGSWRSRRHTIAATMEQHQPSGAEEFPSGARTPVSATFSTSAVGGGAGAERSSTENLGNFGVVKVLGEAFMRRFNAYAEQVGAAFNRVGEIKVVPSLRATLFGPRAIGRKKKQPKRFEVGEIFLEDVCICVDAGVWNDLLGDQVGAAFSPEFRLGVKVGPQELLTSTGEGRTAGEIGILLNEKLIRLLTRLVMRETLKTSTLTSVVLTSLALDTDARVRQQTMNKSLSPPPPQERGEARSDSRSSLVRAFTTSSVTPGGITSHDAKVTEKRGGKLWRGSGRFGSSAPSATVGSELPPTGSGLRRRVLPPPLAGPTSTSARTTGGMDAAGAPATNGTTNHRWRRSVLPRFGASVSVEDAAARGGRLDSGASTDGGSTTGLDNGAATAGAADGRRRGEVVGGESRGGMLRSSSSGKKSTRHTPVAKPKSRRAWRRTSEPAPERVVQSLSPTHQPRTTGWSDSGRAWEWSSNAEGYSGDGVDRSDRLRKRGRALRRQRGASVADAGSNDGRGGAGGDEAGRDREYETVARPPSWMEGVAASAKYEEMKPALDVIKRTVLLAVLQQSNRISSSDSVYGGTSTRSRDGGHWDSSSHGSSEERQELNKELERKMQEELSALKQQGEDVDRLVMKALMARVRDSEPNIAFKALASIEISSLLESLAAETRFATYFENGGVDIGHIARSISGRTAGEMVEGVRMTAGKVGAQAQRMRAEAVRWRKELLDDNGILPLLSDASAGGGGNASLASLVESLSDTILPVNYGVNMPTGGHTHGHLQGHGSGEGSGEGRGAGGLGAGGDAEVVHKDSWQRGETIPANPKERHRRVETGGCAGAFGDREEVDEVDVIMQVLDLLEAVEGLKDGIWKGDIVTLGKVEQAVGKVAEGIDVYLILAAGESMLGFLLERLGMLPVGHAKFVGRGVESRVWNLNLEGVQVARDKVDLVMKGFRLPKRGSPVLTPFGRGTIKRYKKRSRCFVVNLDWRMGNGKSAKAYLQPNDITVLEGRDGPLSDEDKEKGDGRPAKGKVTADRRDIDPLPGSAGDISHTRHEASGGSSAASIRSTGVVKDGRTTTPPTPRLSQGESHSSAAATTGAARNADKGKGRVRSSYLSRVWNRRRSTDTPATDQGRLGSESESESGVGGGVGYSDDNGNAGPRERRQDSHSHFITSLPPATKTRSRACSEAQPPATNSRSRACSEAQLPATNSRSRACSEAQPPATNSRSRACSEAQPPATNSRSRACSEAQPPDTAASTTSRGADAPELAGSEDGNGGEQSGMDGERTQGPPGSHPLPPQSSRKWTADEIEEILISIQGDGDRGDMGGTRSGNRVVRKGESLLGPSGVDILAAPFLVARISEVGAELKDVMWSVKQRHFPHLKTAGSLEATVSDLTIELELDTQDLAVSTPWSARFRMNTATGDIDRGEKEGKTDRSSVGIASGDGHESEQRQEFSGNGVAGGGTPSLGRSTLGDTPKGLRLSRLRVSVSMVKVHVSNSALSSVYNLAAAAFEAAVKRYVVESVEAAVRKSMNALLAMVNHQVSEKWDLLRSVGGGVGGATAQRAAAGSDGASLSPPPSGNAVDKVLAASLARPVKWAPQSSASTRQEETKPATKKPVAGSPTQSDGSTASAAAATNTAAAADLSEAHPGRSSPLSSTSTRGSDGDFRGEGLGSGSTVGSSRASTDSSDIVPGDRRGSGKGDRGEAKVIDECSRSASTDKRANSRRLFRKRFIARGAKDRSVDSRPLNNRAVAAELEMSMTADRAAPAASGKSPAPSTSSWGKVTATPPVLVASSGEDGDRRSRSNNRRRLFSGRMGNGRARTRPVEATTAAEGIEQGEGAAFHGPGGHAIEAAHDAFLGNRRRGLSLNEIAEGMDRAVHTGTPMRSRSLAIRVGRNRR